MQNSSMDTYNEIVCSELLQEILSNDKSALV